MRLAVKQMSIGALAALLVLAIAGVLVLWSGTYSFAADVPHLQAVASTIEFARERSVHVRADAITVPPLEEHGLVIQGAGNYRAMCAQCHLGPGEQGTELSHGLYPSPPDLTDHAVEPAAAFWTIKHGIKASGMPAWGKSMADADIWSLVAFLQKLPTMDVATYRTLVEQSGGHAHGGGSGEGHEDGHSH